MKEKEEKSEEILEENKEEIIREENIVEDTSDEIEEVTEEIKEEEEEEKEIDKYKKKWPKWVKSLVFHLVAIICIILLAVAISPKTLQNDTYYTIPIGEYIYNNGVENLTEDNFSWHELPYTYPHWLYDLGIFIIFKNFGHKGIYISTMIFAAILGISVYALCNIKSKNKVVSFALSLFILYMLKDFIAARAQLITFILFTWTVICIERLIQTKKKIYLVFLLIIPLLIVNLHCAVFPFYFILYLPYVGEFLLISFVDADIDLKIRKLFLKILNKLSKNEDKKQRRLNKIEKLAENKKERIRRRGILRANPYKVKVEKKYIVLLLISVMAISSLFGWLNPAGNGAYTYLYRILQGNTTDLINEHLPVTLVDSDNFAIVLVVFLLILIFTDTKIELHDLFMLGGLTYLSFNSRRQVSMFAIFCGAILAKLIADLVEKYDEKTFKKIENFVSGWFGATVIICIAIILSVNKLKTKLRVEYVDSSTYPVEAADWIIENLDYKNIKLFNEYNYGSYLLFRGIPVFIDSRCDLYTPEFNKYNDDGLEGRDIFSDALDIAGLGLDYRVKFREYGVTHVILYENSKLAMILGNDSDYKTIYRHGNFIIFERLTDDVKTN
mgnify:CR=1 FL=1